MTQEEADMVAEAIVRKQKEARDAEIREGWDRAGQGAVIGALGFFAIMGVMAFIYWWSSP